MAIELAGDIAGIVNGEVMGGDQRTYHFTYFTFARASRTPQYKRGANPLAWLLHHVRKPPKHIRVQSRVAVADIRQKMIFED